MNVPTLECCVWELTLRCNLRCVHCGATAGRVRANELSTAEVLRVADELVTLPAREVTLMGGELFLRPDWLPVAERLREGDVRLVIFTNGTQLTSEGIARLQALKPRTVGTSIDGGGAPRCTMQSAAFLAHSTRAYPRLTTCKEQGCG